MSNRMIHLYYEGSDEVLYLALTQRSLYFVLEENRTPGTVNVFSTNYVTPRYSSGREISHSKILSIAFLYYSL